MDSNGFYLQDPNPDNNSATSEGIFVFRRSRPTVCIGDAIQVSGTVAEFRPDGDFNNLTTTQITSPAITILSRGNALQQALRWSVIFRKVTNGFRSDWGRDLLVAVRSIVNTGRRQGFSAFESILAALNPLESLFPRG